MATTNVVDAIQEMLDKDHDVVVFFQQGTTQLSDDDGRMVLRYLGGATEER